jgi:hypothetical protein
MESHLQFMMNGKSKMAMSRGVVDPSTGDDEDEVEAKWNGKKMSP